LRFAGLVWLALGMLAACVVVAGGYGIFAWFLILGLWFRTALHVRAAQQRSLLSAISLAASRQIPLADAALAFASEEQGAFADRATALARELAGGASLADAARIAHGALPAHAALAARLGAETGDLDEALGVTAESRLFDRGLLRPVMLRLAYVIPVMLGFAWFMHTKIGPSFEKIFQDFDTPLPAITRAVLHAIEYGARSSLPEPVVPMAVISWSMYLFQVLGLVFLLAMVLLGVVAWLEMRGTLRPRLPAWRRIVTWLDMAVVLRALAAAVGRNRPLPGALAIVADDHPKGAMRERLKLVSADVGRGTAWHESLRQRRLISDNDAATLAAAERAGNLSFVLRETAAGYERRANFRVQALAQVIVPLAWLPAGLLAALMAIAYFAPLPDLIRRMSL
jgi:protein transport protein HofC